MDEYDVTGERVDLELTVDAPPDRLWSLITDVSRIGEWSPECEHAAWERPDPAGPKVGDRFHARNRFGHGLVTHVTCVVTEVTAPRSFGWIVLDDRSDLDRPATNWRYELLPADSPGRTLVRQTFVHGPGESGLRKYIRKYPDRAAEILASRLAQLREHMTKTLQAMARG